MKHSRSKIEVAPHPVRTSREGIPTTQPEDLRNPEHGNRGFFLSLSQELSVMRKYLLLLATTLLLAACSETPRTDDRTMVVSILPLRTIVGSIVGSDFDIEVLVPAGASPETFEPTPRQFARMNRARQIFSVGLIDFENSLLSKLEEPQRVVNLSCGIDLIEGSCAHHHDGHEHAHGVDPHIWTSPRALQQMAANAYEAIHAAYPDSTKYTLNYGKLQAALQQLDREVGSRLKAAGTRYFLIYHPALTYYARDYGIRQVAIENEGKEPSARELTRIIKQARADGITRILYQSQFPASAVEIIARDLHATSVAIDPLREDVLANIAEITDQITARP